MVELSTGRHLQYGISNAKEDPEYESGYVTVIRKTPDCPAGKATALFNWKAIAMEVDDHLGELKHELEGFDTDHEKKFIELEKGVQDLYSTSNRLDSRLSGVCHTAVKIGEHLQIADRQKSTANETINLIKYLTEFNSRPLELIKFSLLFSDDARVIEAAAVALKLRFVAELETGATGTGGLGTPSLGLEAALENLQEYCNDLENRLLAIGLYNVIVWNPSILKAIIPYYMYYFFIQDGREGWISLDGVLLCITGAEAMYADVGHVSPTSIKLAFTGVVYPLLMTEYIGQAAYLSKHLDEVEHAFFKSVPGCDVVGNHGVQHA